MRGAKHIDAIRVYQHGSFYDIVHAIEAGKIGIALVIDESGRLVSTITDGDVRRAFLAGHSLSETVERLLTWRHQQGGRVALQAPITATRRQLLDMMKSEGVRQIPLHDLDGRITGISTLAELTLPEAVAPRALIMAGGFGRRMGAMTQVTPKPMLPVGGIPLIERLVRRLALSGVADIYVSLHYLAQKISDHLGDGGRFDVTIHYVHEEVPLGTGGAVGLLPQDDRTLLVINGDLLTNISLNAMTSFHRNASAWLTMGVRTFEQQIAFGVVECDGLNVHRIQEKPTHRHLVNAGVYLLEPEACLAMAPGQRRDMTDLVAELLNQGHRVTAFPILGQWLDVGRPEDYERANREAEPLPPIGEAEGPASSKTTDFIR